MEKKRTNPVSKLFVLGLVFLLGVNLLFGMILMSRSKKAIITLIRDHMLGIAKTAAASLDGDELKTIGKSSVGSDAYVHTYNTLSTFLNNMDVTYIYTAKDLGDGNVIFILDPDPEDPGMYGDAAIATPALMTAISGTPATDQEPFTDRWGTFYSAYAPVFDSAGNVVGIVGADFRADWYQEQISHFTTTMLVSLIITTIVAALLLILTHEHYRRSIRVLYGDLTGLTDTISDLNRQITSDYNLHGPFETKTIHDHDTPEEKAKQVDTMDVFSEKMKEAQAEMQEYLERVRQMSFTDPMTGVGNKTAYLETINRIVKLISHNKGAFSVILLSVEGVKHVNDTYGLNLGDQIIIDAANLIVKIYGREHTFRISGEEFIVVLDQTLSREEFEKYYRDLDHATAEFNAGTRKTYEPPIVFTHGDAFFIPSRDTGFQDVYKRASEALSQNR